MQENEWVITACCKARADVFPTPVPVRITKLQAGRDFCEQVPEQASQRAPHGFAPPRPFLPLPWHALSR